MQNGAVKVSISEDWEKVGDIYIYGHRAQSLYPLLRMRARGN